MSNRTRTIIILCLTAGLWSSVSAQEPVDTIKIIDRTEEVTVTRVGNTTKLVANISDSAGVKKQFIHEIEVSSDDSFHVPDSFDGWEMNIPFLTPRNPSGKEGVEEKVRRSVSLGFAHTYWGWRFNYNEKSHVKNCFEVGVRELIGIKWQRGRRGPGFSMGIGFGMMRFLACDGYAYGKENDAIVIISVREAARVDKSRLDVWRFHVPVLFDFPLGKRGKISVGGIVDLNTYAKATTQLYYGDERDKTLYKGFQQNLLTADLFASVSVGGFGLYCTWSPMKVFKSGFGPGWKAWSIGVDLFTF